jgi:hypothetical protein
MLVQSRRFREHTDSLSAARELGQAQSRVTDALARLDPQSRERYQRLSERCQSILDAQPPDRAGLDVQAEELSRLLSVYLKLLRAQQTLQGLLQEALRSGQDKNSLSLRMVELGEQLGQAPAGELRRSLEGQIDILKQRSERQGEAHQRLAQVSSDLARIEQQVELLREETLLTANTDVLSRRIDTASLGLNETVQWVREQEDMLGDMDDLVDEAPQLLSPARAGRSPGRS